MVTQDSGHAVEDILDAVRSLQKTLSQVRNKHSDFPKIGVRVTETEENKYEGSTGTAAKVIITIGADTAEHAAIYAEIFDRAGCICTSSGETEFTCECG